MRPGGAEGGAEAESASDDGTAADSTLIPLAADPAKRVVLIAGADEAQASAAMRPLARGVRQSAVVPLASPKWSAPSAASPTVAHEDVTRATSTPVAFVQEHALAPCTSNTKSAKKRAQPMGEAKFDLFVGVE